MRARTARLLFIHRRRTEPAAVASQGMHGTHARTWLTWRETGTGALTSRPSAISWGLIYDQYQREGREGARGPKVEAEEGVLIAGPARQPENARMSYTHRTHITAAGYPD